MASAQVMSNSATSSRKQQQLEAGKRRLEEFRKKRAKKTGAVNQPRPATDATVPEKHASENGQMGAVDAESAFTFSGVVTLDSGSSDASNDSVKKSHGFPCGNGIEPNSHINIDSSSSNLNNASSPHLPHTEAGEQECQKNGFSALMPQTDFTHGRRAEVQNADYEENSRRYEDGLLSDQSSARYGLPLQDDTVTAKPERTHSLISTGSSELSMNPNSCVDGVENICPERSGSDWWQRKSDSGNPDISPATSFSELGQSIYGSLKSKNLLVSVDERKPSAVPSLYSDPAQYSEPFSNRFNFDGNTSTSHSSGLLTASETNNPRRTRPSFLDSLNISRSSASSDFLHGEAWKSESNEAFVRHDVAPISQKPSTDMGTMEPPLNPGATNLRGNFVGNTFWSQDSYENHSDQNLEARSQAQNEDFAALEQHIEDLTQEKFSLQRTLDASKALAESLAAENSSLTESYNQQGGVVNQLKYELENLQEEIRAQVAELESIRIQYTNAQLECNAADERAKLLASEVIALEEKALRLRSNELKLEKELEKAQAETTSFKKKLSSLEKERQDLHQTIDALQEEKKLLQNKVRKASVSGISVPVNLKRDMSTSTDDIGVNHLSPGYGEMAESMPATYEEVHQAAALHSTDGDNTQLNLHIGSLGLEIAMAIPPEQKQMIGNINSLLSELMVEKEELMQALVTETAMSSKMKDLNKELSQKLESQTQRLELLTAQNMAHVNVPARQPSGSPVVQENVPYADEGDEVVERVLGWIMKLFPGGPSRRRTNKLL